jgi:hypothetical protein
MAFLGTNTGIYYNYQYIYTTNSTTATVIPTGYYYTNGWSTAATTGTYTWLDTTGNFNNFINAAYTWGQEAFAPLKSLAERVREALRTRIAPAIFTHAKPLGFTKDLREIRARETLQRVIGEDKYKSFLRKGFISVQAKSGLVYQIYPGHDFTKVYDHGKMVDRYCVVLQGGFPPTDSLIMRYLMLLNNEEQFKSYAIKHGAIVKPIQLQVNKQQSLLDLFRELKKAA